MTDITVEFVTVERRIWSGNATMVVAKTVEGELGIQPGHEPLLAALDPSGTVTLYEVDGAKRVAAVQGGFLSVTGEKVSILAEAAEWSDTIDRKTVEQELADAGDNEYLAAFARGRLLALDKAGA